MDYFEDFKRQQKMITEMSRAVQVIPDYSQLAATRLGVFDGMTEAARSVFEESGRQYRDFFALTETWKIDPLGVMDIEVASATLKSPIEEYDRLLKSFEDLNTSPYKMIQALSAGIGRDSLSIKAALSGSITAAQGDIPTLFDWGRNLATAFQSLRFRVDLARDLGIEELVKNLQADTGWISGIKSAASPALAMLTNGLIASATRGSLAPAMAEGFSADLLDYVSRAESIESEEDMDSFIQSILAWIIEHLNRLSGTRLSATALLQIVLWIIPLAYTWYSANQSAVQISGVRQEVVESRDQVLQKMEDMTQEIVKSSNCADPKKDSDRREYALAKSSHLRAGPGKEYEVQGILPPNLIVEEIEQKESWTYIKYFDYVDGEEKQGWVAAELLLEIPREEESK